MELLASTFTKPVKLELQLLNCTVSPTCNPDSLEVPIELIVYILLHKSASSLALNKVCSKHVGELEGLGVILFDILGVKDNEGVLDILGVTDGDIDIEGVREILGVLLIDKLGVLLTLKDGVLLTLNDGVFETESDGLTETDGDVAGVQSLP